MTTIRNADGHNKIVINIIWTLLADFLVMFMQAGFALVETGFTQKKNVVHTLCMNFLINAIGMIGFWICGFAFVFGGALNAVNLGCYVIWEEIKCIGHPHADIIEPAKIIPAFLVPDSCHSFMVLPIQFGYSCLDSRCD